MFYYLMLIFQQIYEEPHPCLHFPTLVGLLHNRNMGQVHIFSFPSFLKPHKRVVRDLVDER